MYSSLVDIVIREYSTPTKRKQLFSDIVGRYEMHLLQAHGPKFNVSDLIRRVSKLNADKQQWIKNPYELFDKLKEIDKEVHLNLDNGPIEEKWHREAEAWIECR